jgi:hypothetical protein
MGNILRWHDNYGALAAHAQLETWLAKPALPLGRCLRATGQAGDAGACFSPRRCFFAFLLLIFSAEIIIFPSKVNRLLRS